MRPLGKTFALAAMALIPAAACSATPVNTGGLPSIANYKSWYHTDVTGKSAGHSGYRVIYVNDTGRNYAGSFYYAPGTVLINEIHDATSSGPGALRSVVIMRKLAPNNTPSGASLQATQRDVLGPHAPGWLFTSASKVGAQETLGHSCYSSCHVQAPYDNAWLNHGSGQSMTDAGPGTPDAGSKGGADAGSADGGVDAAAGTDAL